MQSAEKMNHSSESDLICCSPSIDTVDITGGAPELNPNFRHLVTQVGSTLWPHLILLAFNLKVGKGHGKEGYRPM